MLQLFGSLSLWIALGFALLQCLPIIGHYRNNQYLLAAARPAAFGQFAFILSAYVLITIAFVTSDFSIQYVGMNSHPLLPFMYRLTAVWGGHEGSILLWVFILNIWTVVFAVLQRKNVLMPLTLAVLGVVSVCFLLFLILTSNPFLPATQLLTGMDLNPLLQDPGFVIHPPMLYMGYVGFSATFAITQAGLIRGKLDHAWALITKKYALAAWCFLTFGITLGSWWAYRVLGWGGFWFWDPVENASLLPWLAGTALVHVLVITERREALKGWSTILALISFAMSLLGTFLVRSGVLVSAHTFANDPTRGVFLLILLAFILTVSLAVFMSRSNLFASNKPPFHVISRESGLLLNSGLLIIAMLTILLGTIFPLLVDVLHLDGVSVGAPYFNMVMAPLTYLLMFFMGIGPLCQWQKQDTTPLLKKMTKNLVISLGLAIVLIWTVTNSLQPSAILSLSLSIWIITAVVGAWRLKTGMTLAHIGFAMLVIGVLLSSILSQEVSTKVRPGNTVDIGPYKFFFIDTSGVEGSNYRGIRGEFEVVKHTRHVTNLYPEKRIYLVRDMVMTKVDIHPGVFRDLYIALGEPLEGDAWSVRIYYKPFIRWVWAGSIIMMIGGILSIIGYRPGRRSWS